MSRAELQARIQLLEEQLEQLDEEEHWWVNYYEKMVLRELEKVVQHPLTSMTSVEHTSNVLSVESMLDQAYVHVSTTVRNTKNNGILNIITLQNCLIESAKFSIFS
jgi:hypothetical protein